eukprot:gene13253-biopygen5013
MRGRQGCAERILGRGSARSHFLHREKRLRMRPGRVQDASGTRPGRVRDASVPSNPIVWGASHGTRPWRIRSRFSQVLAQQVQWTGGRWAGAQQLAPFPRRTSRGEGLCATCHPQDARERSCNTSPQNGGGCSRSHPRSRLLPGSLQMGMSTTPWRNEPLEKRAERVALCWISRIRPRA